MAEPAIQRIKPRASVPPERTDNGMPIKIPDNLPARRALEAEGVMVMGEADAVRQDIRPLRIGLLNLMPNKIVTETQIARLLGATPLQIELSLLRVGDHVARNTPASHMESFYQPWSAVCDQRFDGFVVTGAPVERLPFESVTYWRELRRIFDWTQTHVHRSFTICWAAQAALQHFHGVPKHALDRKLFGIYRQRVLEPTSPYLRGFSDSFSVPISRWTEVRRADISAGGGLVVLAEGDTGVCLVDDPRHRALHVFNHFEYDTSSLADEYSRDAALDADTPLPHDYFTGDDPASTLQNRWRSHAHLLFSNWINEIYQTTPFDLSRVGKEQASGPLAATG